VDLQARQMGEVLERIAEPHQHTRASGGSMHVQIVIVRRDPVHGAADFRVDLAQERRQVFFRFGWLNVTLPHAPIRRVMSCVGAEHDDAEAHEQDNKDIRPQRHRKRAIMLKCQMIEPRDRHTEDRRHQGAAQQVGVQRALRRQPRHQPLDALAENHGGPDDSTPIKDPDPDRHRVVCRKRADNRRDEAQADPAQKDQRRRPSTGEPKKTI